MICEWLCTVLLRLDSAASGSRRSFHTEDWQNLVFIFLSSFLQQQDSAKNKCCPRKFHSYFNSKMQGHFHACSGRHPASAEDQQGLRGTLQSWSSAPVKTTAVFGPPADPLYRRMFTSLPKECPLYTVVRITVNIFSHANQTWNKKSRSCSDFWKFDQSSSSRTDNHLCSGGWAGVAWSPVAYLVLLRTSKNVPRQHAQGKKKNKKIKMYLIMVIKVPFFHLQELTF